MYKLIYERQDKLTINLLTEIIEIKMSAWPYAYESQLAWIKANLRGFDIHVLLRENEKSLAYLNLIQIELIVDSNLFIGFGIGNVCSLKKGNGWGKELLIRVNKFLKDNDKFGMLFCKNELVNFYILNGWKLVNNEKLVFSDNNSFDNINTLVCNLPENFKQLKYNGKPF